MSYVRDSTHYNNWIFSREQLARIDRLRHVKAKKALRLEHAQVAAAAAGGSAGIKPVRKPRSFAALVPVSSTAVRDLNDWNDEIDLELEQEEGREEKEGLQVTPLLEHLTLEQEVLVRDFYEAKVQESCTQLFRTSDKVKCCAVMLYKRFYLSNSVMEFHPKYIVPTAIYVAGKVEEQYINVDTIAAQLNVDHKHVIGHEMMLLEGVRFQLIMYHPFRAVLGFVDDFRGFSKSQGRVLPLDALQKLHANACVVLNELLLTELPLCFYPAYLSLAAVRHIAHEMESDPNSGISQGGIDEYIKRSQFSQGKDLAKVHAQLDAVLTRFAELNEQQKQRDQDPVAAEKHAKQIKKVYKKLKAFHVEESSSIGGGDGKKDKDAKKRKSGDKDDDDRKEKKKAKKEKKEKKEKKDKK